MSARKPDPKRRRRPPRTTPRPAGTGSDAAKRDRRRSPPPAADSDARRLAGRAAATARTRLLAPALRLGGVIVAGWLALAERAGALVLRAWRRVLRPGLAALAGLARAAYRALGRHLSPARAVGVVCAVALAALVASQWLDYRTVTVGTDAYAGAAGAVTSAPELERARAGDAHAWLMLPLALAGAVALGLAFAGRPRAARGLIAVGAAVLVLSLAVDAPQGLDLGDVGVAYEGAGASLIEGFWLQVATAAVLIAGGLLLLRHLRPQAVVAGREPQRRRRAGSSTRGGEAAGERGGQARPEPRRGRGPGPRPAGEASG